MDIMFMCDITAVVKQLCYICFINASIRIKIFARHTCFLSMFLQYLNLTIFTSVMKMS
jgi:hypothetical protein